MPCYYVGRLGNVKFREKIFHECCQIRINLWKICFAKILCYTVHWPVMLCNELVCIYCHECCLGLVHNNLCHIASASHVVSYQIEFGSTRIWCDVTWHGATCITMLLQCIVNQPLVLQKNEYLTQIIQKITRKIVAVKLHTNTMKLLCWCKTSRFLQQHCFLVEVH